MTGSADADGNGSSAGCHDSTAGVVGSVTGTDNVVTYDAGASTSVTGVCIKSGNNMFGGNKHSAVLTNGTYENGCYEVTGVGTQVVTVTRLLSGKNCQGISHIEVVT